MKYYKKKPELLKLNEDDESVNELVEKIIENNNSVETVNDLINFCIICNATTAVDGDADGEGNEPRGMIRCKSYTKLPPMRCRCLDLHIIPDTSIVSNFEPSITPPSELPDLMPKCETKRFSLYEYPSYKVTRKLQREPYKVNHNLPPETQYTTIHQSSYSKFKLEPKKKKVHWDDKTLNNKDFCSYRKY